MRRCSVLVPFVGLAVLMGLAGCSPDSRRDGPEMVRITGVVTLDGEPLEGAHIRFSPDVSGPAAFAVSDKRGRYELRTYEPGDGIIPGTYHVTVNKEVVEPGMEFESQVAMEAYLKESGDRPSATKIVNTVPEKYASKKTSGLKAEINVGSAGSFDLELVSK
ncbi:MAG: carboxypeptidase regulatory-like domain-containing protein [Planctomycetaceae bacterium]|nr:carboxypeptidase regulatory-like domain-containing protein [Planctomycetaceae bacterium]